MGPFVATALRCRVCSGFGHGNGVPWLQTEEADIRIGTYKHPFRWLSPVRALSPRHRNHAGQKSSWSYFARFRVPCEGTRRCDHLQARAEPFRLGRLSQTSRTSVGIRVPPLPHWRQCLARRAHLARARRRPAADPRAFAGDFQVRRGAAQRMAALASVSSSFPSSHSVTHLLGKLCFPAVGPAWQPKI